MYVGLPKYLVNWESESESWHLLPSWEFSPSRGLSFSPHFANMCHRSWGGVNLTERLKACIPLPLLVYTPFSGGPSLWRPQEAPLEYSPSCCGHAWSPGSRQSWSCPPCHACRTWAPWWWGTSPDSSWSQSAHPWWRSDLTWHCSWYFAWTGTSANLAYR